MNMWRQLFLSNNKSIAWLALIAVVMLSLFPAHMHVHHDGDAFAESHAQTLHEPVEHVTAIHSISDTRGHGEHDDATIFSTTSDSLINKVNFVFLAILVGFFVFLGINVSSLQFRSSVFVHLRKIYTSISPPLRAPPL